MKKKLSGGAAAAFALLLTACGGTSGHGQFGGGDDCAPVTGNDGPGAGSAGSHGTAQRSDGDVQIGNDGDEFVARQIVSIANDFGGASNATVALKTDNGDVANCVRPGGGYRVAALLEGRGASEQEARDALATMVVNHSDSLSAGTLHLSTTVQFNNPSGGGGGSGSCINVPPVVVGCDSNGGSNQELHRRATILAGLPSTASYALDNSTGNGEAVAIGFNGSSAKLTSGNGEIALDGNWGQSTLDTGNGEVFLRLGTARSGTHNVTTDNGEIDVELAITGSPGFDLSASTGNGEAVIDVPGTEPVGEQTQTSAHKRTPDYASRAVQIGVTANSGNQDVIIH